VNGTTNGLNPNDVTPVDIQQQSDVVPQMTLLLLPQMTLF
jgi:hypothetical protein